MKQLARRALTGLATAALAGALTTAPTAAPALAGTAHAATARAGDYWVRALNSGSGRVTADARCNPGDHVVGGNTVHDAADGEVVEQGPDPDDGGWSGTVDGDGWFHVAAYAHCQ
ncbi:hypothetical protein [Actinomadura verrucosospora]|nr:hypothetical protein [Actinomadura verrucosospora]